MKRFLNYKVSFNLNYFWNWGSIIIILFSIQIISGILLSIWFIPELKEAFASIDFIMREAYYGWLVRYLHSNFASLIFFSIYLHIARSLFYSSYTHPRQFVWASGVFLLFLMMATAFMGYVLPWASMSYWAGIVITSLISIVPVYGDELLELLWGDFGLDQPALSRFFSLHFTIPSLTIFFIFFHMFELHRVKSSDEYNQFLFTETVNFNPVYTIKDILGFVLISVIIGIIIYFNPNLLSHPLNYIKADQLITPLHIVPEWYFLPFYGILRSVPSKEGGILILLAAFAALASLPWQTECRIRSSSFRIIHNIFFWVFSLNFIILGWSASFPISTPFFLITRFCVIIYFVLLLILPVLEDNEKIILRFLRRIFKK